MKKIGIVFGLLLLILTFNSCNETSNLSTSKPEIRSIVVYGDTRTNHEAHREVVNAIERAKPHTVIHTGDLVDNGLIAAQWDTFESITDDLLDEVDFYPALGNHERNSQLYYDRFELPNNEQWYTVTIDSILFIILNSCTTTGEGSEQYVWLENVLQNIGPEAKFVAAVFHHPPYSTGPHTEDEKGLRDSWVPLFEQYDIDIVFNGHDHIYERSYVNGIYYIVAGGGGAPLYKRARQSDYSQVFRSEHCFTRLYHKDDKLAVETIDSRSHQIDYFEIE